MKGKVERTIGYLDTNFWPRMGGETLSLAGLNDHVHGWLSMVDEKNLSGFAESRATRFAREQPVLQPLTALPFDARMDVPVMVSRESLIRHETNSYSVPPEYIGHVLLLKVHPFETCAEVFGPDRSIRRFPLAAGGSRTTRFFPDDRTALHAQWSRDRARQTRIRRPAARTTPPEVDVESRSTMTYEILFAGRQAVGA
ncbi:MAG: hypothetical protein Q8O15_08030 [Rectinemataceae bacterium]|nr:hypothetical protein [Rectinemataceae bacterium]